jgi:hypothetical protein
MSVRTGCDGGKNSCDDAFGVGQYVIVPETKNLKPGITQILVSALVVWLLHLVLATIEFDDQHGIERNKVNDVGVNAVLASELGIEDLFLPQVLPHEPFRVCRIAAQRAPSISVRATVGLVFQDFSSCFAPSPSQPPP